MDAARHGGIGRFCIASRGNIHYKNLYETQNMHSHNVSTR